MSHVEFDGNSFKFEQKEPFNNPLIQEPPTRATFYVPIFNFIIIQTNSRKKETTFSAASFNPKKICVEKPSALMIWGRNPPNPLIEGVYKKGTPRGPSSPAREHRSGPTQKHQQASHSSKRHRQGHNPSVHC